MDLNLSSGAVSRAGTVASHRKAIERVILAMRERLDEPLSLEDLADIAIISPYHFDRVFRQVIGIPPCQFLGALRIEAAKRLLLTTRLSVTEVCLEVGYNSLGTFTSRFTQLVGLAPGRLRKLARMNGSSSSDLSRPHEGPEIESGKADTALSGEVHAPDGFEGVIFVGLFPSPIPQCRPVGCDLLTEPGSYHIPPVPDGSYYLLAAAIPESEWPLLYSQAGNTSPLVGRIDAPLVVEGGQVDGKLDVTLRRLQLTDPPILVALPFLLDAGTSSGVSAHARRAGASSNGRPKANAASAARGSIGAAAANLEAAPNEQSKRRPEFALLV